MHYLNEVEDET